MVPGHLIRSYMLNKKSRYLCPWKSAFIKSFWCIENGLFVFSSITCNIHIIMNMCYYFFFYFWEWSHCTVIYLWPSPIVGLTSLSDSRVGMDSGMDNESHWGIHGAIRKEVLSAGTAKLVGGKHGTAVAKCPQRWPLLQFRKRLPMHVLKRWRELPDDILTPQILLEIMLHPWTSSWFDPLHSFVCLRQCE